MKLTRGILCLALAFSLSFVSFMAVPMRTAIAQEANAAIQRGYRTGYSDGYMAGYRDSIGGATKDLSRHSDYASASRAYNKEYGTIEDYRDGYKQGFEGGYDTGFEKRPFDSAIPTGLSRRTADADVEVPLTPEDATTVPTQVAADTTTDTAPAAASTTTDTPAATTIENISFRAPDDSIITIPKDAELILELQDELSTKTTREGDKFTAKVVSPSELSGAIIEGRVNKIQQPGRIKRRSELAMSFDRIVLSETRWSNFSGVLSEVLPVKGDNVRRVDVEGTAVGKSTLKDDSIKVGGATGSGAAIGAVAGGPVGAAVGAGVGAAFGVGAVVIERGKHIRLNRNQQLRVKSAYEIRIR